MTVSKTSEILTEQQFNNSPLKNVMSYQDYFANVLKSNSTFTLAKLNIMQNIEKTTKKIEDEVEGWYLDKEAKKEEAQERYEAALAQYNSMKSAEYKALKELQYATNMYGEDSSRYRTAYKKWNSSAKTLFGAGIDLSCTRDAFYSANLGAFKAFLTARIAQS